MTRHVFTLVWNRKRSTLLIMIELFVCFLALCGILAAAVSLAGRWREPLGFDWRDVWQVQVEGARFVGADEEELARTLATLRQVLAEARRVEGVESAALGANIPYGRSSWMNTVWIDGREAETLYGPATPEIRETLGLELLYGRWLEEGDRALSYTPVVVSRNLARDLFGSEDAVGQVMPRFGDHGEIEEPANESDVRRVVGVFADVKRRGELDPVPYAAWCPADLEEGDFLPSQIAVRVRPDAGADFEERFIRALQAAAPDWSYSMAPLERRRADYLREKVTPLLLAAVVAAFLIVMVGLGLVGVLWQSVTRRTAELGVRRALGASAAAVRRQVLGELWALTTLSVALGSALFLQLPLVGQNFGLGWPVFVLGLFLAAVVLYVFVTLCGLYPTWLATRVQPAEALQYE